MRANALWNGLKPAEIGPASGKPKFMQAQRMHSDSRVHPHRQNKHRLFRKKAQKGGFRRWGGNEKRKRKEEAKKWHDDEEWM